MIKSAMEVEVMSEFIQNNPRQFIIEEYGPDIKAHDFLPIEYDTAIDGVAIRPGGRGYLISYSFPKVLEIDQNLRKQGKTHIMSSSIDKDKVAMTTHFKCDCENEVSGKEAAEKMDKEFEKKAEQILMEKEAEEILSEKPLADSSKDYMEDA